MIAWYNLFSYWIFIWFVLYYIGLIRYNPKLILLIGVFINILGFFNITKNRIYYLIIVFLDKIIPLYLIKDREVVRDDFIFTAFVTLFYIFVLHLQNIDIIKHYTIDLKNRAEQGESPGIRTLISLHKNKDYYK